MPRFEREYGGPRLAIAPHPALWRLCSGCNGCNPRQHLTAISRALGSRPPSAIKPYEIEDWLRGLKRKPGTLNRYPARPVTIDSFEVRLCRTSLAAIHWAFLPEEEFRLGLLSLMLLFGCGGVHSFSAPGAIHLQGSVHGGQQPISRALIQMYAAGTTG